MASEGWFAAYDKTAQPGIGLGAATEADLFRQEFYDQQGQNSHIRLAYLMNFSVDHTPKRLRAWHRFRPFDDDEQLNQLIRWAAGCLGLQNIQPPTVHWPQPIDYEPDLADRQQEWPIIKNLLAGQLRERIVLIEGGTGLGKSVLLRETRQYAKRLNIPVVWIELKGGAVTNQEIMGHFDLELGARLPNFSRENAEKVLLLRKDLRAMKEPVLVVLDSYEAAADNKTITDWLSQQLFNEVETALGLCLIVAGQSVPPFANAGWRSLVKHVPLKPINEIEHWQSWVDKRYPEFCTSRADLPTVLMAAQGNPALVASMCEAIIGFKSL